MIEIKEDLSKELPTYTSLFIKLPKNIPSIITNIKQQEVYWLDYNTFILELPLNRLSYIVKLLIPFDDVKFIQYIDSPLEVLKEPLKAFKIKPYKYQEEGIKFGLLHNKWLLLDDQGLGKTLQMIYLAESLYEQEKIDHCVIICGVASLRYNWANEIRKFSCLSYTILGQTFSKRGKVRKIGVKDRCEDLKQGIKEFFIITNIETLQGRAKDGKDFAKAFNTSKEKYNMIVLDEAHMCKSSTSKAAKSLLRLKSDYKIALSGTIIENEPGDSYVALKWIDAIKCNKGMFDHLYNVYGGFANKQVVGYKNLELLKDLIAHHSLRRKKDEVLDLPKKNYIIEYVEMSPKQQELYDNIQQGIAEELDLLPKDKKLTIMEEITMNMRSRQVTAWPGILTTEDIPSAKLDRLESLVEQIISQGDKVIIFSTFKSTLPEVLRRLERYNPIAVSGDTPDEELNVLKKEFEINPDKKVFIGTWQKIGTGFTMTAANYAIFIDTPWNNSKFEQCADRIYRIGQTKPVFIITLITKNTYDERVQELVEMKGISADYIIDGKESGKLIQVDDIE
mgnify:CR=1 FL=1